MTLNLKIPIGCFGHHAVPLWRRGEHTLVEDPVALAFAFRDQRMAFSPYKLDRPVRSRRRGVRDDPLGRRGCLADKGLHGKQSETGAEGAGDGGHDGNTSPFRPQLQRCDPLCRPLGQRLAFDTECNYPLPNLYVAMLQQIGIETDRFASSTGTMRGLEVA